MSEKEKYIEVPIIKSVDSISKIENGEWKDFDVIYYNNVGNIQESSKLYAYRVKDDTMKPTIYENDIVIFEKKETFSNLDICVVKIGNEEAVIRRIVKENGHILLESLNRKYMTTIYEEKDLNDIIKIIGRAIGLIREL